MKTSLKKLQKFAALKHDKRAQKQHQFLALDELARATRDMNDMRDCYDRLLSAAAATANSVYEFSESLREMGDCLLEKTALNDDEESGKVLLMLGKVQFELQKLVDGYRSHIFQTITIPSESLLNELRIVEEMKKRCDGKREIYEELLKKQKEKGKSRNSKGEYFNSPQLKEAHEEYDEDANVFVFRMKSLKQGQSRSFLTQASRHHAAQLSFFKKAVKSLEAIEPHVRLLAEQQHIDYHFVGLKDYGHGVSDDDDYDDDESDADDDSDDGSETQDDGELSFDHGPSQEGSTLSNSMELDSTDAPSPPDIKLSATRDFPGSSRRNSFSFHTGVRVSKSAPLFPEKKFDSSQVGPSPSRKFTSYVLPTPDETKSVVSGKLSNENPQTNPHPILSHRHSSPLDPQKYEKLLTTEKSSGPIILDAQSVLRDSNTNTNKGNPSRPLPPPLSEGLSFKQPDPNIGSYAKKAKRQAFSGPLTGKPWPNSPNLTSSGPIAPTPYRSPFSGSLLRTPVPRPSSTPKLSSRASSSTFVSSPKISELHELPRPPTNLEASRRPANRFAHSGPLISQTHEMSTGSVSAVSAAASTLPTPPQALSRSFSIPTGGPQEAALRVPLEGSENVKMAEDASSPPLTPVSFSNAHTGSPTS